MASATEASNGSADSKSVAKAHTVLDISLWHVAVAMCGNVWQSMRGSMKLKENAVSNSAAAGDIWNIEMQIEGDAEIL